MNKIGVDHLFYRHNWDIMKRLYRAVLLKSGELCTVCGIAMINSYLKISADWRIPLILLGFTVTEENSSPLENIYDINRFKAILADTKNISRDEINHFLIYPSLNPFLQKFYQKSGKFGTIVCPFYYINKKTEEEIEKTVCKEMNWQSTKKHSDCLAEAFSNLVREHRHGYSRKVCYYSNMIRAGELAREKALAMLAEEDPLKETQMTDLFLKRLEISRQDLEEIFKIKPFKYEKYCYRPNLMRALSRFR